MNRVLILMILSAMISCNSTGEKTNDKPVVSVSILPQKYFVEQIAGDLVEVNVMVPPGASPATYEPSVSQLRELNRSDVYLRIGYIAFELSWMEKIRAVNKEMNIADLSNGIDLIGGHEHHDGHTESVDPHIWLSPANAKIICRNIFESLSAVLPQQKGLLQNNLRNFETRLDSLDKAIGGSLKEVSVRSFMIYHPALTYYARDYDLHQFPLELEGKSPSSSHMKMLSDQAKEEHIQIIFLQMQFDQHNAMALARETGARIIQIDPLDPKWFDQMLYITEQLKNQH